MDIKAVVDGICRKYDSRNPYDIATQKNIIVLFESLGTVRGYYQHTYRQKIIHVNSTLEERKQLFTCAHELGHAIMHPDLNTPFLKNNTFFSVDKLEVEANRFAIQMLYSDDYLKDFGECTVNQVATCLNLPTSLVEYRLRSIK